MEDRETLAVLFVEEGETLAVLLVEEGEMLVAPLNMRQRDVPIGCSHDVEMWVVPVKAGGGDWLLWLVEIGSY